MEGLSGIVLRNLKLRYQLLILISVSIFMIILIQVIYYFSFSGLIQKNAELYAVNTVNQAEAKLDSTARSIEQAAYFAAYSPTVQDYLSADYYYSTREFENKLELQKHVENHLKTLVYSNSNILDICLVDRMGNLFTAFSEFDYSLYVLLNREYKINEQTSPFFTNMVINSGRVCYFYILPVYNMDPKYPRSELFKLGECIIFCKADELAMTVENTIVSENSLFMLIDRNNRIVQSTDQSMVGDIFEEEFVDLVTAERYYRKNRYLGKECLIQGAVNSNMGWKIISIIPVSELTRQMDDIRKSGIFIGFITLLLTSAIGYVFIRNITDPIAKIVKMMDHIGEINIKQRIELKVKNEVGIIANDINKMLDKIENMTKNIFNMHTKLYEAELSKKEAELSALQSQINPHFLYNTLECIRSIALNHRIPEIVRISTSMARIFRYCIKGENYVTVEEEIGCIVNYLNIISIRFMGKIQNQICVDENIMKLPIIKMILQPLVENAVYHGMEAKVGPGNIIVKGIMLEDRIEFHIIDDGVGMDEEMVAKINEEINMRNGKVEANDLFSKRSIGLVNISNRIKLYYGNEYGLSISSKVNEGTKVVVSLPIPGTVHNEIQKTGELFP